MISRYRFNYYAYYKGIIKTYYINTIFTISIFSNILQLLIKWLECSLMAWVTWVQSQVESYQRFKKWYLMPPRLTLSIIR